MRVTYVTRSFLDYRIPVYEALNQKLDNQFHVIYSADYIPNRVDTKIRKAFGDRTIGMRGEKRLGPNELPDFANTAIRVVYQPGLLKAIAKTKPEVLVGDGFFQWTSMALLYKIFNKCPLVVCYERTSHTERNVQWYRTAYRRLAMRFVDAMACNGQLSLEYSTSLGMEKPRITTGHMVADNEHLKAAAASFPMRDRVKLRRSWDEPDIVFLAVGKLNERKGIRELLFAWSILEKNRPGKWALVLIGDGSDEQKLKALGKDLKLKRVIFQGPADYNDIAQHYASADVFIMPTLEDNWSLVVPEAMACGLPVLCSKYNGCYPELILSGKNGWVFDPLDPQDTYRALKTSIDNRSQLREMGEKSRDIVAQYSPENAADSILAACSIALSYRP